MSRVLTTYLLRRSLLGAALTLAALVWVYLACSVGDQGRRAAAMLGWNEALRLMVWHLPLAAVQLAPAAVLLGLVIALSSAQQRGELEAVAALGASRRQLAVPLLITGLLATLLCVVVTEWVVPLCERRADLVAGEALVSSLTGVSSPPTRWLTLPGGWVFAARRVTHSPRAEAPPVLRAWRVSAAGHLSGPLEPGAQRAGAEPAPWAEARDLERWLRQRPEALSTPALLRQRRAASRAGHDPTLTTLVLHTRLAYPWLCVVLAGAAAALVTGVGRPSLASSLGGALAWLGLSWIAVAGGWLLGRTLVIGPVAAAWGPVLGLGLVAVASASWGRKRRPSRSRQPA
ncbi:MAG: LptF/LptG family permease [Proteobacteria bacterium]|nr:LptF/LptG family permease [Pseudomonadota bacterium]